MTNSNYNKFPIVAVPNHENSVANGWSEISSELTSNSGSIIVVECYQGIHYKDVKEQVKKNIDCELLIDVSEAFKTSDEIDELTYPDVTDDRIFGYMSRLNIDAFFDQGKVVSLRKLIENATGRVVIFGHGASYVAGHCDTLIYADMARWEIQQRMRRHEVNNLGLSNAREEFAWQYKRAFFVDWRVCDQLKKNIWSSIDYFLDTNQQESPKLVKGKAIRDGLKQTLTQPFRVVPFFDPGPWGGQWMKEVFDLDQSQENFAWCFDCVPEENSLLLQFGEHVIEMPSINLVFAHPSELLGGPVYARFGDEFPIRFDFLDTMKGGNLSLQVHPLTGYIQEKFGVNYTQDESYYMLDTGDNAFVYLGLKEGVDPKKMIDELNEAQKNEVDFDAEKHVAKWPMKKHDHVLIPAGTVHCSGSESMVLEISATPYIFTFKLWDWGRLGLDGKPRPINIKHGSEVIQWDRTTSWVKDNLVNNIQEIADGDGWREERTGLHELEFIETRRHWFTKTVSHFTDGSVNVLNLIEGREAIVESPSNKFEPFVVHYAETFIVPAVVGAYTIRPYGESLGKECGTIKAYIRHN